MTGEESGRSRSEVGPAQVSLDRNRYQRQQWEEHSRDGHSTCKGPEVGCTQPVWRAGRPAKQEHGLGTKVEVGTVDRELGGDECIKPLSLSPHQIKNGQLVWL